MLEEVRGSTVTDEVIKQIVRLVKEGKLKPGDKLPSELELMNELNVGRSTIREAKKVLVSKQLLESTPGRGTYIKALDFEGLFDEDILEVLLNDGDVLEALYETREILETETSILAAQRANEHDIQKMKDALQKMKEAEDAEEVYYRGFKFHISIAKASHNPVLVRLHYIILKMLSKNQRNRYKVDVQEEIRIHDDLFQAICRHDVEEANRCMNRHFEYVRKVSESD